jgi:hypothetical protein
MTTQQTTATTNTTPTPPTTIVAIRRRTNMHVIGGMEAMEARLADRPQTAGQVEAYRAVLAEHPEAIVVTCADERTGVRFGMAVRRRGLCRKIGGARQPRWYQAWATWAPRDLADAQSLTGSNR